LKKEIIPLTEFEKIKIEESVDNIDCNTLLSENYFEIFLKNGNITHINLDNIDVISYQQETIEIIFNSNRSITLEGFLNQNLYGHYLYYIRYKKLLQDKLLKTQDLIQLSMSNKEKGENNAEKS